MPTKNKKPWLLLDVSYLAYRAYFAFRGKLSHDDIPTTVIFGILKDILTLKETFETDRVAFCFDFGKPHRKDDLPQYKTTRHENKTEAEVAGVLEVRAQVKQMRKEYLAELGYQNILYQKRYEADDVIASVVQSNPSERFVIVSSDHDLYQLLSPSVSLYNPHQRATITLQVFRDTYGIEPATWVDVKALAGCSSDDIPGVDGVGEKTAIQFLTGNLKQGKKYQAIIKATQQWQKNVPLVLLPYPGIRKFELVEDSISLESWRAFMSRLGMASLMNTLPGMPLSSVGMEKASLGIFKNEKTPRSRK